MALNGGIAAVRHMNRNIRRWGVVCYSLAAEVGTELATEMVIEWLEAVTCALKP